MGFGANIGGAAAFDVHCALQSSVQDTLSGVVDASEEPKEPNVIETMAIRIANDFAALLPKNRFSRRQLAQATAAFAAKVFVLLTSRVEKTL